MSSSSDRKLGFTGSRTGMTTCQYRMVKALIEFWNPTEAHHGLCVGSDALFHDMIREFAPECTIYGHSPLKTSLIAKRACDVLLPAKEYHERDRDIVDACKVLIGCPSTKSPYRGSGTWYTIGYAREIGRKVFTIFPDGEWE